ncbi:MAG: S8 family serine peptidase [Acidobacteriia bacterium]|nr:S8 family serine peptidase [Terriglobia bacterium]
MRIAIIDSGIHEGHPHVGRVAGSVHATATGWGDDPMDHLGHGTAVAAAIREKMPRADLFAVKIFDRRLSANIEAVLRGLRWCRDEGMDFVNLSLGTANPDHRDRFMEALAGEMVVISAAPMLPGSLAGVIGVDSDESCPRDAFRYEDGVFYASPYPRPIPGVPKSQNLQGISFAVANMTGLAAQVREAAPRKDIWSALLERATYLPEASSESVRSEYSATSGEA